MIAPSSPSHRSLRALGTIVAFFLVVVIGCGRLGIGDDAIPTDGATEDTLSDGDAPPTKCTTAKECDDGVTCTDDFCSSGVCTHAKKDTDHDTFVDLASFIRARKTASPRTRRERASTFKCRAMPATRSRATSSRRAKAEARRSRHLIAWATKPHAATDTASICVAARSARLGGFRGRACFSWVELTRIERAASRVR